MNDDNNLKAQIRVGSRWMIPAAIGQGRADAARRPCGCSRGELLLMYTSANDHHLPVLLLNQAYRLKKAPEQGDARRVLIS
jgi:hypothetical protein